MTRRIREPVQVYLDPTDRDLLDRVAHKSGLPRTEVLRRGLRHLAASTLTEGAPGSSLKELIGALGDDASVPTDLAERHDEYLYGPRKRARTRGN